MFVVMISEPLLYQTESDPWLGHSLVLLRRSGAAAVGQHIHVQAKKFIFFNYWNFTPPPALFRQHSRPKNGHKTLSALALNNLSSVSITRPRPLLPHIYKILILLLLLCHVCGCGMENLIMKPMFVALSHMSDSCFYWSLSPACQLPVSGISLCWNERFHNPIRNLLFRAFLCFIMALWVDLLIFSCPS